MSHKERPVHILMAEDDEDDILLAQDAFAEAKLVNSLVTVADGEELLEYLRREGRYAGTEAPTPSLILLDLNMPRKDGRETLAELKADPALHRIPVVVLTSSKAEEDILRTYGLGVAGYIVKPVNFGGLVDIVRNLANYWFRMVELPDGGGD